MPLTGEMPIGRDRVRGGHGQFHAVEAASGQEIGPAFGGASKDDLERACALAESAFDAYRDAPLEVRATFLETIADNIVDLGPELVDRCMAETGLLKGRVEGERGRTAGQLRLFAEEVRRGRFLGVRIDHALLDRKPLPRADLRLRNVPVGPVAVFGASNFPLAFSVAGGDTASALAAGCPVVVKAHSAHPGTSELVGFAVQQAVKDCALPEGVFSLLFDSGREIGQALVADRRIKAVGFTGSRAGGTALMKIAAARREPIPVYAEMSSINPVAILPAAMAARGADIGREFVAALTLGAGQFCTNPGLVLALRGNGYAEFVSSARSALEQSAAATMLTAGICKSYGEGLEKLGSHPGVTELARGRPANPFQGQAGLFETPAADFLADIALQQEIFGAASLVVVCESPEQLTEVVASLEGQLTIAVHFDEGDNILAGRLLPLLEKKAGRIVANGFGTGVEVTHAMVHGGPFPATSDGRSTSVGTLAISRFLRPVSYQSFPQGLLPKALLDANPGNVPQQVDGPDGD